MANNALSSLRKQAQELRNEAGDLKKEATKLQEGNVEGKDRLTLMTHVERVLNLTQLGEYFIKLGMDEAPFSYLSLILLVTCASYSLYLCINCIRACLQLSYFLQVH